MDDKRSEGPIVDAKGLSKSYGSAPILNRITAIVRPGERIGLVGANGAGKSTLARVLAAIEPPDEGVVSRRRGATVAYLPQQPSLDPTKTPRQIVESGLVEWAAAKERWDRLTEMLATRSDDPELLAEHTAAAGEMERFGGWEVGHRVEAVLEQIGIVDLERPVGDMSGGERRRVALSHLLIARPDLAILDEPSNHLDIPTVEWLERFLVESFEGAFLLITHDRYLLDRACNRTWELSQGTLHAYEGGYQTYLEAKAEREMLEARTEQNRQNFLRKELEWLRRQPKARSGKQRARIQRAETARDTAAPVVNKRVLIDAVETRSGKTVLELRNVGITLADQRLVNDLTLAMRPGERMGVVGANGCGKTTLLKTMLGELEPTDGEVIRGQNTTVAYFDQHRTGLDDNKSILENVADKRNVIEFGGRDIEPRSYLERFNFAPKRQSQPVGSLSGGERARVALAKLLSMPSNLVVFDEPTNDLDVMTLGALEEMLIGYRGTVIVVTHDRYFLNRVATSVLAFEADASVVLYAGGYDDFRGQQLARAEQLSAPSAQATGKADSPATTPSSEAMPSKSAPAPVLKKLTYSEEKELDEILELVETAEARAVALEEAFSDPNLYVDGPERGAKLTSDLEAARVELAKLTARWEHLEARRAAHPRR